MSIRVIDILNDCQKLIQASKEMGLQRIAMISNIPVKAVELVADALEKQIPKKPYIRKQYEMQGIPATWYSSHCPGCEREMGEWDEHYGFIGCHKGKFCPECGQAIDWKEGEEVVEAD